MGAPDRVADRINDILAGGEPRERVAVCQRLILDTLALVPPSPGVARARRAVGETLRRHAP